MKTSAQFYMKIVIPGSLIVLIFLAFETASLACEPEEPDWWFTEVFSVTKTSLLANVVFESEVEYQQGLLKISNQSATPLYLLAQQGEAVEQLPVPLPEGSIPTRKLNEGQSLKRTLQELSAFAPGLQDRNERYTERPANVELPEPQRSQIQMVYGDRLVTAPLTLTYVLNPDYDPSKLTADPCKDIFEEIALDSGGEATVDAQTGQTGLLPNKQTELVLGLVGLTTIGLIGWLVWWWQRKN